MNDNLKERLTDMSVLASSRTPADALQYIEELEADNARLETEAKLQAEEIDKTRRRADKWQSMVLDCGEYLKPGETPAERIEREINDCLALMKLLEKKQMRIQELEAENRLLRDAVYIDDLTVTMQANDRSKAMTAIRRALDFLNADMPTEAKTALRTTLAELTGGKDE